MYEILKILNSIYHLMMEQVRLQKRILNSDEASKFVGISKSDLYKKTSSNSIPLHKPSGKLIYFLREDLENWMLSNRIESHDEITDKAASLKINRKGGLS